MRAALLLYEHVDEYALAGLQAALASPVALGLAPPAWALETVGSDAMVRGASGLRLVPDALGYARARDADVLLVPGGPGTRALERDPLASRVLREHHAEGRWTGAVAEGVPLLGRVGLLRERRAAAARSLRDAVQAAGAEVAVGPRVVEDGRVLTAAGPAAAVELGLQLVGRLLTMDAALRCAEALEVKGWAPAVRPPG